MASCYDCIHCGACSDAGDSGFSSLKEDASECQHYKNKEDVEEVKRGEWIEDGYNDIPCACSYCGSEASYQKIFMGTETKRTEYIKTPYCPNCGADMRSIENESEVEK